MCGGKTSGTGRYSRRSTNRRTAQGPQCHGASRQPRRTHCRDPDPIRSRWYDSGQGSDTEYAGVIAMAETTTQKQQRIAAELQQIMTEQVPALDFSVGTVLYELLVKPASVFFSAQETEMDVLRANMSLVQVLNQVDPDPTAVDNLLSNF